jgi:hypothetical protein
MNLPRLSWSNVFKALFMCGLLLLLGFSVLLWYVTTDSFQQMARNRVVAGLERATGGKVELGTFHAVPLRRQVEVRDLTIHGKEAAGEQPYVHVDNMTAVINLSSALGAKLAFHSLILQHQVIHIKPAHTGPGGERCTGTTVCAICQKAGGQEGRALVAGPAHSVGFQFK